MLAQVAGGVFGVVLANLMFGLPAVNISSHVRSGMGLWLGEIVATLGLLLVVFGLVRSKNTQVAPFAVGAYITGAYFFTSSTSFANPAVTLARTLSDTFAGIAPSSVPGFVLAQVRGRTDRLRCDSRAVARGESSRSGCRRAARSRGRPARGSLTLREQPPPPAGCAQVRTARPWRNTSLGGHTALLR